MVAASSSFVDSFGLHVGDCVSVVGCGGKTSLCNRLAMEFRDKGGFYRHRVLLATTTKIYPPIGVADRHRYGDVPPDELPPPGIDCVGVFDASFGKVCALPGNLLYDLFPRYDIALIEADGSRGLPLKGWREDEPAVPPFSTCTVGVISANAVGVSADETNVLRLQAFKRITALETGAIVHPEDIASLIYNKNGMFQHCAGRKILFINQVENARTARNAAALVAALAKAGKSKSGFFERIVVGSAQTGTCERLNLR